MIAPAPERLMVAAARGFEFADLYALALLGAGVAVLTAVVALSQQSERAFSAAVVYLVMGAAASVGLHAAGTDLLDPFEDTDILEHAAELAVIVAIFSAGIRLDRPLTARGWASTIRLIGVAMPVTITAVTLFAHGLMGLPLGAAIVLGAVLAPTDPVLAGEVQVGPPGSRDAPEPRFALTSEAGLNDGLAFPFVFLGLFVAASEPGWALDWLVADVVYAIAIGVLVGALGGLLLADAIAALRRRGLLHAKYEAWLAVATVLAIYGATEILGAYGFLAAFAGGLAFRRRERDDEYHGRVHSGAETIEKVSELALVLLLGSTVTLAGLAEPGLAGWVLAPVLLLVIRPAATILSFWGSALSLPERGFIAWFGVRGIGSFYYAAVAIGAGVLGSADASLIYWTVIICTGVSIIAHGITATPAARVLRARASR
jgi:NhaP-type Na+/H+ or K+/H+ antiporter